jgi:TRAP-type uncharacterized transport system fused permease subunit
MKLIESLRDGGLTFAQLLTAIAAVSIVISTLSATGVPVKFGVLMAAALDQSLLVALIVVAGGCVILGMGMPTLPAYVTVAAIALPAMRSLGLEPLTAHMFVFMIAVASTITPPVAIAAYAAAAISGGRPIATGVEASRIGVMIFVIPFAFAYNPLLLTVEQAGGQFELMAYVWLLLRLVLAMYLLGSGLSRCQLGPLAAWNVVVRLVLAVAVLAPHPWLPGVASVLGVGLIGLHHWRSRQGLRLGAG